MPSEQQRTISQQIATILHMRSQKSYEYILAQHKTRKQEQAAAREKEHASTELIKNSAGKLIKKTTSKQACIIAEKLGFKKKLLFERTTDI